MSVATAKSFFDGLIGAASGPIATYQASFLATSGFYFQGLQTPGPSVPNFDAPLFPDITRRPTDHPHTWRALSSRLVGSFPGAVAVDYYGGSLGAGYDLRVMVRDGTATWIRTVSYGPEAS